MKMKLWKKAVALLLGSTLLFWLCTACDIHDRYPPPSNHELLIPPPRSLLPPATPFLSFYQVV